MQIGLVCRNSTNKHLLQKKKEKNFFNNSCIPQSSLDASTNFQANSTKSDFLPRAFLAPTMRS